MLPFLSGRPLQAPKNIACSFVLVELSIAQALIYNALGNPSAAEAELGKALEIAAPAGFVRVFDDGPELAGLLNRVAAKGLYPEFSRQLLASSRQMPEIAKPILAASKHGSRQDGLVEPLSERELEVLRLLADGLTPARVANYLVLSPNTLKAHTQNIYSKLDVHTRIEAINKARDLGLI